MLSAIILARSLDTGGFATYSYFQLTIAMLGVYAAMGLGVTASRYFAEVGHERPGEPRPPLGTLCALSVLMAIVALVLVLLVPEDVLMGDLSIPRLLLAAGVGVVALGVVPNGGILGLELYRRAAVVSALSGGLMLLGSWWAGKQQSPIIAMQVLVLAGLVQATGLYLLIGSETGWSKMAEGFRLRVENIRHVYVFAGPMLLVSLMSASGSWIVGRIVLRGPSGEFEFAMFAIGVQWFSLTLLLPGTISKVVLPRLVRTKGSGSGESKQFVVQAATLATATAVVMAVCGVLFGPRMLALYGEQYEAGRWFIGAFMGAAVLSAPINSIGNALMAHDGQRAWLLLTGIWFLVLITVALAVAGWGALSGAASHASAAAIFGALAAMVARKRELI